MSAPSATVPSKDFAALPGPSGEDKPAPIGVLLRSIGRVSTPVVLEGMLSTGVLLTDAIMLSRLPENELMLSVTALTSVLLWRMMGIFAFTQAGVAASVARRWGEGRSTQAGRILAHSVVLSMIAGSACVLLLWPLAPFLFTILQGFGKGVDPEVRDASVIYFRIVLITMPLRLTLYNLGSAMRSAGNTFVPMILMLGMVLSNAVLNWVFIFGNLGAPAMGLKGSAVATAIAFLLWPSVGLAMLARGIATQPTPGTRMRPGALPLLKLQRSGFRAWIPGVTPRLLKVSVPHLFEQICTSIGFLSYLSMIASFGRITLAAHTATVRIESLSFTSGFALGTATSALVGQALGAKSPATATRIFGLSTLLAMGCMGSLGLVLIFLPDPFLELFKLSEDVRVVARRLMAIVGLEQCLMAAGVTLAGGLRGAGDTKASFLTEFLGQVCVRVGLGYLLAFHFGMGVYGLYWATVFDWLVRASVLAIFVLRGRWKHVEV